MSYIKLRERVFPIGRLDYNTSGLLLLTNDGDFANRVMHPRYEIEKTYIVQLNKPINIEAIRRMESGVKLEDGKTSPAKVRKIDETVIEITIHEGKNRIIRRIIEKLGYNVRTLERIRVGNLWLGNLREGKYRNLTEKEIRKL